VSGSKSIQRTTRPLSSASSSQGATLASWSIRDSTISSPALNERPRQRDMCRVSVVMFCPNTISSECGDRGVGGIHQFACRPGRAKKSTEIGVFLKQRFHGAVDHPLRHLRACGIIEITTGFSVIA